MDGVDGELHPDDEGQGRFRDVDHRRSERLDEDLAVRARDVVPAVRLMAGFIFVFFVQKGNCGHLLSSSLARFDKCHETSQIFPRTEQTFASARSFRVIS